MRVRKSLHACSCLRVQEKASCRTHWFDMVRHTATGAQKTTAKQDAEGNLILATATHTHLTRSDMSFGEQSNNQKQEQLRSETREFQWFRAREELHAKNKV